MHLYIITLTLSPAGQLPVAVSEDVPHEAYGDDNEPPPPLPPKIEEDDVGMSLQTPRTKPEKGSAPSRPPKSSRYKCGVCHISFRMHFKIKIPSHNDPTCCYNQC